MFKTELHITAFKMCKIKTFVLFFMKEQLSCLAHELINRKFPISGLSGLLLSNTEEILVRHLSLSRYVDKMMHALFSLIWLRFGWLMMTFWWTTGLWLRYYIGRKHFTDKTHLENEIVCCACDTYTISPFDWEIQ